MKCEGSVHHWSVNLVGRVPLPLWWYCACRMIRVEWSPPDNYRMSWWSPAEGGDA
jgi:hypothetical protein